MARIMKHIRSWVRAKLNSMVSRWYEEQGRRWREKVLSLLEQDDSAKVIDLGCGNGWFTKELGRRILTSDLYGVNIEAEHCRQAETKGIKTLCADLNNPVPLPDESFDVVHVYQVMEEIHQLDTFVEEIHRLLKKGGYAVILTPNLASVTNILFLLLGWQPTCAHLSDHVYLGNPYDRGEPISEHRANVRVLTYRGLADLFEHYGFIVEKIVGVGYFMFPNRISQLLSLIDPRHCNRLIIKARKPLQ